MNSRENFFTWLNTLQLIACSRFGRFQPNTQSLSYLWFNNILWHVSPVITVEFDPRDKWMSETNFPRVLSRLIWIACFLFIKQQIVEPFYLVRVRMICLAVSQDPQSQTDDKVSVKFFSHLFRQKFSLRIFVVFLVSLQFTKPTLISRFFWCSAEDVVPAIAVDWMRTRSIH